ncbi:MAG: DUF1593 domain-containing protein, partial [Bacteroidetes bacterium]
ADWLRAHILSQGPLGALYRVWGDGKQMVEGDIFDFFGLAGRYTEAELREMGYIVWMPLQEPGSWLSEGDTPTFMNLLQNGLRAHQAGAPGGWGGRPSERLISFHAEDSTATDSGQTDLISLIVSQEDPAEASTFPAFFPPAQRDFAARMAWSVTPRYDGANHPPRVQIEGPLERRARAGAPISLSGTATDPDGDGLNVRWFQFPEAGIAKATFSQPEALETEVILPEAAQSGQVFQFVLEVTDTGTPALTRYQRVAVTVSP